ncbi:MAG: hypothetical protein F9K29_03620 [Hyphomicrobiaceae bacterium]|nr:MAG: hypothetical protein F9K29_03620 [Hyphomicrobiaceae bacterium]
MRFALAVAFVLSLCSGADAQYFCQGCGCKGGSGWRLNTGQQKCVGCEPELTKRCGKPATKRCTFEGEQYLAKIRINCPMK